MKYISWLLIIIFLSSIVTASSYELVNHEPITVNKRTFELSGRGEDQVYIKVDGQSTKVTRELELKKGVFMQLINYNDPYSDNPLTATVEIYMVYDCGNEVCELGENQYCCTDCNCTANFTCAQNMCLETSLFECFNNSECNDNDACTWDNCTGAPTECLHSPVVQCITDDGCCPEGCNNTIDYINNDHDCLPEPECWTDFDCNDSDETTIDLCDKREKFCKFEQMVVKGQIIEKPKENITQEKPAIEQKEIDYTIPFIIGVILFILFASIKIFKNYKNNTINNEEKGVRFKTKYKKEKAKDRSSFR